MKIKVIGPRVLIKPKKREEKTKGGIYLPETASEEQKQGIVIEVGSYEEKDKKMPVKKGDYVIYGGYSSQEVYIDGEKHYIVDVKDVLAIIEDKD